MENETAVAVVERQAAMVPFADMERMALAIAKSGLFGMKTPEQALALMLIAQAEGMHPAVIARDYDIIQGRPAKKAEAMQRSFLQAGGNIEWHQLDDKKADATFTHPSGGTLRIVWDMERAKQAGLAGKDMWSKYPRQMLRSRCVSEGIRTVWPLATGGMYVPEEVQDMQEIRNVTPTLRQRMNGATTMEELNEIAKEVANLPDDEKKALREVYRTKGEALLAMQPQTTEKQPERQQEQSAAESEGNGKKRPKALQSVVEQSQQQKEESQPETVSRDVI